MKGRMRDRMRGKMAIFLPGLARAGAIAIALTPVTWGRLAMAQPAAIFVPHLNEIMASAPPGFPIRLPAEINPLDGLDPEALSVNVLASQVPLTLTVGLFRCETGALPCYVGGVTIDRSDALHARTELERHRRVGDRLTFRPGLVGYLIDGINRRASERFTSIMWQQDNVIYTLTFAAGDSSASWRSHRQAVIAMAGSMALSDPIRVTLPRTIPASRPPL